MCHIEHLTWYLGKKLGIPFILLVIEVRKPKFQKCKITGYGYYDGKKQTALKCTEILFFIIQIGRTQQAYFSSQGLILLQNLNLAIKIVIFEILWKKHASQNDIFKLHRLYIRIVRYNIYIIYYIVDFLKVA